MTVTNPPGGDSAFLVVFPSRWLSLPLAYPPHDSDFPHPRQNLRHHPSR
ncbi:hypothetical protein BN874_120062 [Candidatus Contendobacter odensis Run_B_J11]|uniref:Uncharacterized protein n=1 Tax=Candidatus Contendobacter odensis Run_B_J11 TaxID=1400861 RepID=A0A7U7G8F9_9GAMM|nr:hypothetical protein BN874_120062 [Candidatus Contendobacter odensis Run_B_J11]